MSDKLRRTDDRNKQQLELTQDIHLAIYGDGNGKPGLITKVDRIETWVYHVVPNGLKLFFTIVCLAGGAVWWFAQTVVTK